MMGMPFEGHALVGYDQAGKQSISYWIDTTMAGLMTSKGAFDPDSKTVTMEGTCPNPSGGKPMTTKETLTYEGNADTKVLHMEFNAEQGTMKMEIRYVRKGKK